MKKIALIFVTTLLIFSCTKQIEIPLKKVGENNHLRANVDGQEKKFTTKNLTYISKGVAKLSEDKDFKVLLYSEIDKRFDGDDNVLIETLNKKLKLKNKSLLEVIKEMNNESDIENAKKVYDSFKNINKLEYFPQIFIPNYSNLKSLGKIGKQKPILYIYNGDENDNKSENYKGYKIINGKMTEITGVNEKFASENEVWVVSINERVIGDNKGNIVKDLFSKARIASTISNEWKIDKVKVKVNLEGWAAGSAEVRLCAYINYFLPSLNKVVFNDLFTFQLGEPLDLGNGYNVGQEKIVNKRLIENWKSTSYFKDNQLLLDVSNNQSTIIHFLIFEHDSWPVGNRSHAFGNDALINYRSSDPFYTSGTLYSANGSLWSYMDGVGISTNSDRIDCQLKVIP
jgi:hypothetical protein